MGCSDRAKFLLNELLKEEPFNDNIDVNLIREMCEMKSKREKALQDHAIWQRSDGRYCSYVQQLNGKRKLICKNDKAQVEDLIIEYYEQSLNNPTVKDIYDEWMDGKLAREEITETTKNRYDRQYNQCLAEFGKRHIKTIEPYDVEDFILSTIHDLELTPKGFSNFRTLVFGIFKHAKKKRLIDWSISDTVNDMEISRKAFKRKRHTDDELVFFDEEIQKLNDVIEDFGLDSLNLAILLLFNTGMRPGEVVALKRKDISLQKVEVYKTEVVQRVNGSEVYEVADRTKTEAGERTVMIPSSATNLMKKILRLNPFGDPEEFVFQKNGKRITTTQLRERQKRLCKKAGITVKSPNKIRKTYASILIDKGVAESIITQQMGHTSIKTTEMYYHKNRFNENEIIQAIDLAVCK